MSILVLALQACSTFQPSAEVEDLDLRARAHTETRNDIRVSATVLGREEARALFGVDLAAKGVQPVWIEVENNSQRPLWFMSAGLDPEYFSPLEVAYAYHAKFAGERNAALDEHFDALSFRNPILPGANVSGFVHTNLNVGTKVVDIDLVARDRLENFTFLVEVPGTRVHLPDFAHLYRDDEVSHYEDEQTLRTALERLPCCALDARGRQMEPLNLVLIGEFEDWVAAFIQRGYRYAPAAPRFVFGRVQDLSGEKMAQWVAAQGHRTRMWRAPLTFRRQPVWVGQTSQRLGGRFAAGDQSANAEAAVDPDVDAARNALIQDLFYSQGLAKLGFVEGSGIGAGTRRPSSEQREAGYRTDGLRAVMLFQNDPVSLGEMQFFDWVRLTDRTLEAAQGAERGE
ncbi:MAG: hypothetical protein GWN84_23090 [Gammaproteobacteria bacterium]|nr:hypothetical protein [Gammaproteobacteria bacterium]NIR85494.1 hypothetical protein [Gammaproteobacteria bacterium]NIR89546.1 hypothetical protein [Gammaproteobacteria bacterium]NIU06631.1 hypothetical protein [Gammaproteobacteria bacterium]NIV53514.1 hypothetical protein [Gammaproteobacteria bacterium]